MKEMIRKGLILARTGFGNTTGVGARNGRILEPTSPAFYDTRSGGYDNRLERSTFFFASHRCLERSFVE